MDKTEERLMKDHTVTLNEVDIHYRTIGEGPVLFLVSPGWGVASGYLQRAFSSLAKQLRLVFIDTRGSGLSGRPADPMRMGSVDMANDLEALRAHLGLSEMSILGHSNSGAIALAYAARSRHSSWLADMIIFALWHYLSGCTRASPNLG